MINDYQIAGIAAGALIAFAVLGCAIYWLSRRHARKNKNKSKDMDEDDTSLIGDKEVPWGFDSAIRLVRGNSIRRAKVPSTSMKGRQQE